MKSLPSPWYFANSSVAAAATMAADCRRPRCRMLGLCGCLLLPGSTGGCAIPCTLPLVENSPAHRCCMVLPVMEPESGHSQRRRRRAAKVMVSIMTQGGMHAVCTLPLRMSLRSHCQFLNPRGIHIKLHGQTIRSAARNSLVRMRLPATKSAVAVQRLLPYVFKSCRNGGSRCGNHHNKGSVALHLLVKQCFKGTGSLHLSGAHS